MVTLTERTIMKSRSGVYSDTSENRRKHRVGQKYGAEKQPEDGEKTEKKETDPAKELEAVNKVIAAINEGKLNLPAAEVIKLSEKKQKLEAEKKQAVKANAGGEANEEKKNAKEAKEANKKVNGASKKKKYAEMDIKEAKKELLGKEITFKKYFFDGVDSYKDAVGKINQVRLYGKEKQPVLAADFPNGDSVQISLKQLDERKASEYEIGFDEKVGGEKPEPPKEKEKEVDKRQNQKLREKQKNEEKESSSKKGEPKNKEKLEQKPDKASDTTYQSQQKEKKENNLQRRKELSEKVERLIAEKKKKFPNPDIESPMSDEEKRLTKEISDVWSEINKLVKENRKTKEEPKPEPEHDESEESYTRIKFDDVPNSGKVNLKKYLSEKMKRSADENLGVLSKVSFENLQVMEKGLIKEFNSQFGSLSKSRRAEKLYSIMKVKSELENRKQEEIKKYQKYTSSLDDNTLLSIGYDLGEEIRKLSSRGFSTLGQQQEVLKKISELSEKRQINEDEQRKRMDKLNNSPDETRAEDGKRRDGKREKETKIEMKSINGLTSTQIVAEFKKTFAGEKFSISSSDKPGVYDIYYFDNEAVGNGKAAVGVLSIDKGKKKVIVEKEQKDDKVYSKTVDFAERLAKLQKYKIIYA